MGVEQALARAGARDGDVVRIGAVELDYEEAHRLSGAVVGREGRDVVDHARARASSTTPRSLKLCRRARGRARRAATRSCS